MTKAILSSPIGAILIDDDERWLRSIHILDGVETIPAGYGEPAPASLAAEVRRQLNAYFADRDSGFDLPLAPASSERGTALRAAIAAIPSGDTLSYGALARIAGSGPRAIGQACARNPFPVIIPCHRVVGSGGAIGHYSGGRGVATKRWLLNHERRGGLL
ncbi:methylated-DNA--[protein]-cysteine S-methyltransferase [Sphingomonas sp. SRS2]|uniref:methylated-DNA--[protein]-cysteine S-methyltransferase n=1 Tax=Sphingomonas sp. SRS2 TaxID=133190 RepID=UPI00061847E4|nr:methylated-DNA--[protein]-cysteine S-methyltransferase [Sphingomonas sp. SRS2]KKC26534.1 cysteine methyltransferase [Sphingomonas sp. SRS2]